MFVALFVRTGVFSLTGVFRIYSDGLRSNALTGAVFELSAGLVNEDTGLIISGFKVASGVSFLGAVWVILNPVCDGAATIIVACGI